MSDVFKTRKFEQDGFTIIVERVFDIGHSPETPEQMQANYSGCTDAEKAEYYKQDKKRFDGLLRGEWSYVGVAVRVLKQTSTNWANGGLEVGRSSVWGIESDSDESHFAEMERDEIAGALAEVDKLKAVLCGGGK
jgi:hypothetical protein